MVEERCPLHRKGERNVFCPFYRACLDEAVSKTWAYWDCSECEYRSTHDPKTDILSSMGGDSMEVHDLPSGMNDE
jgi:Zn-finger protein